MSRLLAVFCALLPFCFGGWIHKPHTSNYPFMDPTLSWEKRVNDLANRLTLQEMTDQMANGGRLTFAPGIDRLGIAPYPWGSECLRGDVQAGSATSFPQALGLSASFSRQVVFNVSRATGIEVRAKYNNYSANHDYSQHKSASCWSPVINIVRDPRWGRNQETYGEDPYMSGALSQAFVRGLQGDHPRYIMTNAGCKHFDAYGGPENIPESRHSFDAKVSETDLRMTFFPAFKACVEAGTYSIMCSYNSVNGVPACASKFLLTDVLRNEWGFNGYVISDEGAIEDILGNHKYTKSIPETAAASVNAGCNLEDGPGYGITPYFSGITDAVKQGLLNISTVREAVKPLFYTRMRLGLFDPPDHNPYAKLDPTQVVQSKEHRDLAISSAMRTFVLLKNNGSFLPLSPRQMFDTLAIVGPMADNIDGIFGGYSPEPDPAYIKTPKQGLSPLGKTTRYAVGCANSDTKCGDYDSGSIMQAVHGADLVVVCLGTGANIEQESNDRADIELPGHQADLLEDAVKYADGKPVVLLMFNAGAMNITWAKYSPGVSVILEGFFPAQAAGEALFNVFYNNMGSASNPGGRLPATWPASLEHMPGMTNYTMEGRTYRYMAEEPLYPFGYGLSFTTFQYSSLSVRPEQVHYTDDIFVDVYVLNTGKYDGEEVVQVYVEWADTSMKGTPMRQLVAFERYVIDAGQAVSAHFIVTLDQLAVWDEGRKGFVPPKGTYTFYVGGQQPHQSDNNNVGSNVLQQSITVS